MDKNELKYIQSFAQKKHWIQESVYLIEGPKLLEEALKSNIEIKKIYATRDWLGSNDIGDIEFEEVDDIMLPRLSQLQTANQVLALVYKKEITSADYSKQLTLVLDGIQDPGNLGTIIRTADWFGIHHIIVSEDTASVYNPKVIQSTMGSFLRVNVIEGDLSQLLEGKEVFATLMNGKSIRTMDRPTHGVLIIGNEANGIEASTLKAIAHTAITIPGNGHTESLNAAMATAICCERLVVAE